MTSSDGRTANEVHVHKLEKRSRYNRTRTRHKWRTDKHIRNTSNRRQQNKNRIRGGRHVVKGGVVREVCVGIKQNQPPPSTPLPQTSLLALSVPFFAWILVSIWSNTLLIMNKTHERSSQRLPSASCRLACLQGGTRLCLRCLIVVPRDFWFRHFVKKFTCVSFLQIGIRCPFRVPETADWRRGNSTPISLVVKSAECDFWARIPHFLQTFFRSCLVERNSH